jgi:monomeric sarcosine oxidase
VSDVVVIGGGVFGAWTAHHLSEAGARVTLVDAHGPGNSRSSSGDESRILRFGYGPDEIYSRFARRSREQWCKLDARSEPGLPLWHPCGVLWMAPADHTYTAETFATLRRHQYQVEVLDQAALAARYPQLVADDVAFAMVEPGGGVLMARRSVQALTAELARKGVVVKLGRALKPSKPGRVSALRLADGTELPGDVFVFACGAWLPAVFPELLGQRITPTRQAVLYFGTPAGDDRFAARRLPAWVDFASGIYGIPDLEGRGLKIGIDTHGPRFDPDTGDRTIDRESIATARSWLGRRFPDMADAPLIESRVCQYENTSTGDFLIDRHPDHENVWLAGGGSGHGFKHGPAVGEYVTRLITTNTTPEARFALDSKGTVARRSIY